MSCGRWVALVSANDFVLEAAGSVLLKVPEVNRTLEGGRILQRGQIDGGVAVALPEGLLSPVLRGIDPLSVPLVGARSHAVLPKGRAARSSSSRSAEPAASL